MQRRSAVRSANIQQLSLVFALDPAPAMAGDLRQPKSVADDEAATHHFDKPIVPELKKAVSNACTTHSEKLSKHLVRERDLVRSQGVAREQEPSSKALL
jgi:hypothetical protein